MDSVEVNEVLMEEEEEKMKKFFIGIKEVCQYVGIILVACGAAVWLMMMGKDK